jgi:hypothetical protein
LRCGFVRRRREEMVLVWDNGDVCRDDEMIR